MEAALKLSLKDVNLFVPGAAKSGTSTLHNLLNLHPKINMSSNKEPHIWSMANREEMDADWSVSRDYFQKEKGIEYYGESSTGYFYFKNFKINLKKYGNPNAKFIFILRNPIDRTYSHYTYLKSLGSEDESLRKAILENHKHEPSTDDVLPELIIKNYYQYSLYGKWMERFYEVFDSKNVKIILFENLKTKPLDTLNECFNFLGLTPLAKIPEIKSNKTVQLRFPKTYKKIRILVFNKNKTSDILKHFLPKDFRRKYKKKATEIFLNLNKTNKTLPKLSQKDRTWLYDLFSEDVALLKKVTKMEFKLWKDFNKE